MIADLERVTAPGYLSHLAERPLDEVRSMRAECQALENGLSYVRRLAQGRLDIVGGELARRRSGAGSAKDATELLASLTDTLVDPQRSPATAAARPPQEMEAAHESVHELQGMLNAILSAAGLAAVVDRSDSELGELVSELEQFEAVVSGSRRTIHGLIDHLQAEITRRYRTGEASVDSLLG